MSDWNRQKHQLILALKLFFAIYWMFLIYLYEIDTFPAGVFSIWNINLYSFKVNRNACCDLGSFISSSVQSTYLA